MFALEEWVELANGCLCCSLKDDFLRALEALMEQRQRFDYILVETTGATLLSFLLCWADSAYFRMGACFHLQHHKAQALAHWHPGLVLFLHWMCILLAIDCESLRADLAAPTASVLWVHTML